MEYYIFTKDSYINYEQNDALLSIYGWMKLPSFCMYKSMWILKKKKKILLAKTFKCCIYTNFKGRYHFEDCHFARCLECWCNLFSFSFLFFFFSFFFVFCNRKVLFYMFTRIFANNIEINLINEQHIPKEYA